MESARLFISIFTITFIGWNILYLISAKGKRLYFSERLAISYGLGFGLVSLEMCIFYLLNAKFSLAKILIPWTPLLLMNLIIYFKGAKESFVRKSPAIGGKARLALKIILISGITFEVLYVLFRALIKPVESYDAVAIYAIRSKIFYLAKAIPKDFFYSLNTLFPHPDYPLNIPLSETFIYLFLGNLNDQLVKIIFPLYFISTLVVFYHGLRRFAGKAYSLLFTFILATIPQFNAYATNAYLDLPLAYYYFISALFLFLWFENRSQVQPLLISATFVALAGWTKNEGLMYCIINILLMFTFFILEDKKISRKNIGYLLGYLTIVLVISLPWLWIKRSVNLVNTDVGAINMGSFNLFKQSYKIWPIIYEFQRQFFGPKKWNILWPAAFLILIFNYKKAFAGIQKYITIPLSLAISGYVLFYMISRVEIRYFLNKTWSRFPIHFLPIVIYWMANMLKDDVDI